MNRHPVKTDEDSVPESSSDTENWLDWNGDLGYPNVSEDNCATDNESDMEKQNGIDEPECAELHHVSATANVHGLVRPTQNWMRQVEKILVTVNAIGTRRNNEVKNK